MSKSLCRRRFLVYNQSPNRRDGNNVTELYKKDETDPQEKKSTEPPMQPNFAIWILTFMTVIGVFYAAVFYTGSGTISLINPFSLTLD